MVISIPSLSGRQLQMPVPVPCARLWTLSFRTDVVVTLSAHSGSVLRLITARALAATHLYRVRAYLTTAGPRHQQPSSEAEGVSHSLKPSSGLSPDLNHISWRALPRRSPEFTQYMSVSSTQQLHNIDALDAHRDRQTRTLKRNLSSGAHARPLLLVLQGAAARP